MGPNLLASSMENLGALFPDRLLREKPGHNPCLGKRDGVAAHPLPSGGPHTAKSTSRRRFPARCENVQFVAPSLTLKNVPLFTVISFNHCEVAGNLLGKLSQIGWNNCTVAGMENSLELVFILP